MYNFQVPNVQPQGAVNIYLVFCQYQPCFAYKNVAYKKVWSVCHMAMA